MSKRFKFNAIGLEEMGSLGQGICLRGANGESSLGAKVAEPSNEKLKALEARPYQYELFEKAKKENIIVYLGTGSGKTFIAVMLIKHMRSLLGYVQNGVIQGGKKIIFLVSSVALVDQQAREIKNCTDLEVGKFCGADGVDGWDMDRWLHEISRYQVLVFVHEVFRSVMSSNFMKFRDVALLILDECHHAVKNHPYSKIMDYYQTAKERREEVPKILGLTACVVVKTCTKDAFVSEKLKLEKKMDSKVQTTEDLKEILKYVTAPSESLVSFTRDYPRSETEQINTLIENTIDELSTVNEDEKTRISRTPSGINTIAAAKRDLSSDFKKLKNEVLVNLQHLVENLGLYSIMSTIDGIIRQAQEDYLKESNLYYSSETRAKFYEITTKCLEEIGRVCKRLEANASLSPLQMLIQFSSIKFRNLLDVYRAEKEKDEEEDLYFKKLSCITFVERKSMAVRLSYMLTKLSELDPEFSELRVNYVHAIDNGFSTKTFEFDNTIGKRERQRLQDVLAMFRRGELNILVSTKVVEEGLDVRSCNLVIKYDFPKEFRSYVQSKGRARSKPSKYIMLYSDEKEFDAYTKYQEVEKLSLELCHTMPDEILDMEDEEEEDETFTADPSQPDVTGTVNGSQATSLIYQYISKIPVDRFTKLVPAWTTVECQGQAQDRLLAGLGQISQSGYRVTCYMPHKTPFVAPVEGPVRPSKVWAKRACSIKVVRQLYEFGELDIRLKVKKRERPSDSDDEEEEDACNRFKTGTRRKRHFYRQQLPPQLRDNPVNFGYLYQVSLRLGTAIPNARYAVYRPEDDKLALGILTRTKIAEIGPLQLYGPSGDISASIRFCGQVDLEDEILGKARLFTNYAFKEVLKIPRVESTGTGFLVVPLEDGAVNFDLMRDRQADPIDVDSVITPKYKECSDHYFVEEVLKCMNPSMQMSENKDTYIQYFKKKYNIDIQDHGQPLLRISSADKKLYMYKPGGESVKDATSEDIHKRTLLVPELMAQARIPSGLWKQIQVLPFCLERMSSLLHAANLSVQLTGLPSADSQYLHSIQGSWFSAATQSRARQGLMDQLLIYDAGLPLENLNLLEALTLRGADDVFDMERLEVLGDVFLKYRTSIFLYYNLVADTAKDKVHVNEGELTLLRSKVVGNKNLFFVATSNLGLQLGPVNSVKINTHTTFLPPGFNCPGEDRLIQLDAQLPGLIEDEQRRSTLTVGSLLNYINNTEVEQSNESLLSSARSRVLDKKAAGGIILREHRLVSDKSLADVVEALIGAFLANSGQNNTLKVMARMGLDMTSGNSDLLAAKHNLLNHVINHDIQVVEEFPAEKSAFKNTRLHNDHWRAQMLYERLPCQEIERKIGYVFKEKSFLLQAFTHSSYSENNLTDSYERLEYLGDAVLDYLVTCYIFTHSTADQGDLTDIRSALVCNNTFAALLVDLQLHGHIQYSAPQVRKMIVEYVDSRKEDVFNITKAPTTAPAASSNFVKINGTYTDNLKLINESEPPELKEAEVPKVLGDVLEALMGAVFIDSGHDLNTVWKVFLRFKPRLDEFMKNPPMNPKKVLMETFKNVKFGSAIARTNDVKVSVTFAHANKEYRFSGLGQNKRQAERAAAKCALKSFGIRNY